MKRQILLVFALFSAAVCWAQKTRPTIELPQNDSAAVERISAYLMSQVDRSSLPEWKKEWNKFNYTPDMYGESALYRKLGYMPAKTSKELNNSMSGRYEPSALLPCQLPADMKTVEEQCEDLPFDIECYVDSEGNTYDFAFGMNWSGVIKDKRVKRWKR